MKWQIDGVQQRVAGFDMELGTRLVASTKVLAGLRTYRRDQPQEERIMNDMLDSCRVATGTRVVTLPTLYGGASSNSSV